MSNYKYYTWYYTPETFSSQAIFIYCSPLKWKTNPNYLAGFEITGDKNLNTYHKFTWGMVNTLEDLSEVDYKLVKDKKILNKLYKLMLAEARRIIAQIFYQI